MVSSRGLYGTNGVAATPFTQSPYTWDMNVGSLVTGAELHGLTITAAGTFAGGSTGLVGLNVVTTTAGSAGMWANAIYARVVEGTTKNVNGYISVAEFQAEVAQTTAPPCSIQILALNSAVTHTGMRSGSGMAYIGLHDYGSDAGVFNGQTSMNALFLFAEQTISGTDPDGTSLLAPNTIAISTHTIRFLIGATPYYIMCADTTHN